MRAIMLMKLRGIASLGSHRTNSSPLAPSSGSSWELLDEREMSLASDGVAAAALLSFSKANFPRKYFGTCGECTSYIYYATSL